MPLIRPFDAWQYQPGQAGSWETLCCPPYDVVSPEEQRALEARNPHNCIMIERPTGDQPYAKAAALINDWRRSGVLARSGSDAFYIFEMEFTAPDGKTHKLRGFTGRCELTPFADGQVLPHEETLSKAKADRLELMKAVKCNISPIYALYRDPGRLVMSELDGEADGRAPDVSFEMDGIINRMWRMADKSAADRVSEFFAGKAVFIADGHHRYETALNYRNLLVEQGAHLSNGHPANYVMMTLVDMENPGLVVLPTHRVVYGCAPDAVSKLLEGAKALFLVEDCAPDEIGSALAAKQGAIAMYAGPGKAVLLTPRGPEAMRDLVPDACQAYRELDVAVLQTLLLEPYFGIDKRALAEQRSLIYTRDSREAMDMVDGGKAQCAFLLSPTRVSQILDVSLAGGKMPQKSTYFYPKLITGLYINGLE
jgi:uncharacterized protein (DUF1015 family)